VINLSGNKRRTFAEIFRVLKPGGRMVIADVVCETEPGAAIKNDATLRGECIAGALTQRDLFGLLEESGFVASRVVKRFPYRVVQGHPFFSLTFEARKPIITETRRVMYRGPFTALITSRGDILPVGVTREIPLDELPVDPENLFVFDEAGAIANIALSPPSCCPPAVSACCSPAESPKGKPISVVAPESPCCPGPRAEVWELKLILSAQDESQDEPFGL
jgi:SAM-dependent methyltransferase